MRGLDWLRVGAYEADAGIAKAIAWAIDAHNNCPKKPSKAFRKWDGWTPYWIHPVWCGLALLHETSIHEEFRLSGAEALILHDVLEDTNKDLPEWISPRVEGHVKRMIFSSFEEEMEEILKSQDEEQQILRLFDKVSNLLDGVWMSPDKRARYAVYTLRLSEFVEERYGVLNITRMARAIVDE